jgi:hypothetical protein
MWLSPIKHLILLIAATLVVTSVFVLSVVGYLSISNAYLIVAIILIIVYLPPYILIPIHLHRHHWLSAQPEYQAIDPARDVIPEEAWLRIREGVAKLKSCGFQVVGHYQKSGQNSGAMGYLTLLQSASLITVARLVTVFGTAIKGRPAKGSLVFITELADSTKLVTSNNLNAGLTPRRKGRIRLWMPEVQDPRDLYEFHERLVRKFGKEPKASELNGDLAQYLKDHGDDQRAHWIKKRYYWLESSSQLHRLTWKGAVMLAWKQLWPLKPLLRVRRRHQTNKLLRKLEE